ncbi:unnamed protein product, partial [Symbiodinium necroappetens]
VALYDTSSRTLGGDIAVASVQFTDDDFHENSIGGTVSWQRGAATTDFGFVSEFQLYLAEDALGTNERMIDSVGASRSSYEITNVSRRMSEYGCSAGFPDWWVTLGMALPQELTKGDVCDGGKVSVTILQSAKEHNHNDVLQFNHILRDPYFYFYELHHVFHSNFDHILVFFNKHHKQHDFDIIQHHYLYLDIFHIIDNHQHQHLIHKHTIHEQQYVINFLNLVVLVKHVVHFHIQFIYFHQQHQHLIYEHFIHEQQHDNDDNDVNIFVKLVVHVHLKFINVHQHHQHLIYKHFIHKQQHYIDLVDFNIFVKHFVHIHVQLIYFNQQHQHLFYEHVIHKQQHYIDLVDFNIFVKHFVHVHLKLIYFHQQH